MIIGITRVRDESLIIADTLEHFFQWCDHIVLYDDLSHDNTVEIAQQIGGYRITIIRGDRYRKDRQMENTRHRKIAFDSAEEMGADWILCFDADERLSGPLQPWPDEMGVDGMLPFINDDEDFDGFKFRLFDGYLTDDRRDEFTPGNDLAKLPRMWGPEYRDILMLFRPGFARWERTGLRAPQFTGRVGFAATYVKHFGKCMSIEHWEETCRYYMRNFPPAFRQRWASRRGKAIHTQSDFGRQLFTWHKLMSRPEIWEEL